MSPERVKTAVQNISHVHRLLTCVQGADRSHFISTHLVSRVFFIFRHHTCALSEFLGSPLQLLYVSYIRISQTYMEDLFH